MRASGSFLMLVTLLFAAAAPAAAQVRVQDIARLQGQRTNKLMGYGLVVGLPGTGDGSQYAPTMRALARLHERYHAPILLADDVKANKSVAIVAVEAVIPEHGAREGQAVDVVVSVVGAAKSLQGGQLLTTPLQYAMFDANDPATQYILALAGGRVEIPDANAPTRGVVRRGAVLEQDFIYTFIAGDTITLVLDDEHAGWNWAHVVARSINATLRNPATGSRNANAGGHGAGPADDPAYAIGPKNVIVRIPAWELYNPARFISSVEATVLFDLPAQAARVTINRTTGNVSFTAGVRVSPTVLQIPGIGTIKVGRPADADDPLAEAPVGFNDLFAILSSIQLTDAQLIAAIEHLHKSGTLHAQLYYE